MSRSKPKKPERHTLYVTCGGCQRPPLSVRIREDSAHAGRVRGDMSPSSAAPGAWIRPSAPRGRPRAAAAVARAQFRVCVLLLNRPVKACAMGGLTSQRASSGNSPGVVEGICVHATRAQHMLGGVCMCVGIACAATPGTADAHAGRMDSCTLRARRRCRTRAHACPPHATPGARVLAPAVGRAACGRT